MKIPLILIYISIILWIFPIIKQYKTEYFLFFLILAIADPIKLLLYLFFHLGSQRFSWITALFLITSLITKARTKLTLFTVSLIAITISFLYKIDITVMMLISCLLHIVILGIIILNLFNRFVITETLNLFLCLLILYESLNVMKYLAYLSSYDAGAFSWFVGGVSQYLFALLFTFINISTKEFHFISKN
jgi:hypothetical protein